MRKINEKYILAFKALGDDNRMKIIEMLSGGELCGCKILDRLNMSQPTLSHHMKLLCDCGIVKGRKDGKWMRYSINKEVIVGIELFLKDIVNNDGALSLENVKGGNNIMGENVDLYLLTGFLGSGKTTVLIKLLEELKEERVGVIQNEFGKLGIDGAILRNDNIKMVEINRGSIFCSCLKLSFVEALAEMTKQDLKYLFVESSGLGDPSNMEEILEAVRVLVGDKYKYKGTICLVDAVNFEEQIEDIETVNRQLKHCELCVITKVDLVEPEKIDEIKVKIKEVNNLCPIRLSSKGNLDLDFIKEDLLKYKWAQCEESTNSPETKPKSIFLNFMGKLPQEKLAMFLDDVKKEAYRVKGFFNLEESGWNEVNVVGDLVDFKPCEDKEISQLVFISKIGPQIIRTIAKAWKENSKEEMELKN